jgi:hypothetical protein
MGQGEEEGGLREEASRGSDDHSGGVVQPAHRFVEAVTGEEAGESEASNRHHEPRCQESQDPVQPP